MKVIPAQIQATPPRSFAFRKKFLIYPRFQLTLIAVNSIVLLAGFSVISYQVSRVLEKFRQTGLDLHLGPSHPYYKFLGLESTVLVSYLAWGFAVAAVISNLAILLISHRVAGPIVRLKGYLESFSSGNPASGKPLEFRKGDFFGELAPAVNQALGLVSERDDSRRKAS